MFLPAYFSSKMKDALLTWYIQLNEILCIHETFQLPSRQDWKALLINGRTCIPEVTGYRSTLQ